VRRWAGGLCLGVTFGVAGFAVGKEGKVGGKQPNVHDAALYSFAPAMEDYRLAGFDPFLAFTCGNIISLRCVCVQWCNGGVKTK
jgi:hypothetical protein